MSNHDFIDTVFRNARSQNGWLPRPVGDEQLREIYEHMKWGPTSVNCSPARIVFVFDHTFSPPAQADADVLTEARRFASSHGIRVFDSGSDNIHHVIVESDL